MPEESETLWTLHDLQVLTHHYCTAEPWPFSASKAYNQSVSTLSEMDMLDDRKNPPSVTARGQVFLQMLRQTPAPVQKFVDPRNGKRVPNG